MAFNPFTVLRSLLIKRSGTLNPDSVEIVPNGSAGTKTTIQSSQTVARTLTLPDATDTLATVTQVNTVQTNLDNHINDTTDAHDASAISNVPAGSISATDVQAAINELDGDIQGHITDTVDAHDASAISVVPSGNLAATDVQSALVELQTDVDSRQPAGNYITGLTGDVVATGPGSVTSTIQPGVVTDSKLSTGINANKIGAGTVDNTEFGYLDGVTSAIQTQLNAKVNKAGDSMTGTLTLNADPVNSLEAATKQYVDSVAAGLDPKQAVRVATTAPLGGTYATTPSNGRFTGAATTVDTITLVAGDRVLVKDQVDQKQNGIYVYDGAGQYTRSPDMDGSPASEVSAGNYTFATQGPTNQSSGFVLTGNGIFTLNTDNLVFTQFSGSGGASRNLDNLLAPTAINQDLLPSSTNTRSLGSSSLQYQNVHSNIITANTVTTPSVNSNSSLSLTSNSNGFAVTLESSISTSANSGAINIRSGNGSGTFIQSGTVNINSGNSANSSSGNVVVTTGNASLTSGDINLQTGTSGTTRGQILLNSRQVDVNNTKIVNLADPTAAQDAATKQYVDANGGIGNLDAMFRQEFDSAILANFTQTGLDLTTTNPIKGTRSARLPHAAASTNSFKQVISVDRKFRGQNMTLSLTMQSTAVQGDVTLNIYDETNAANIVASEQLSTFSSILTSVTTTNSSPNIVIAAQLEVNALKVGERVTGSGIPANSVITAINTTTRTVTLSQNATASDTVSLRNSDLPSKQSVSFIIPENCASISYTVSALQEPNTPESYFDDILIELAESAATTTSVEVPVLEGPVSAGQITIGATTTAPTKPSARETDEVVYTRDGKYADITYRYTATNAAGASAGSGTYLFSLPAGLTMDTVLQPNNGASVTLGNLTARAAIPGTYSSRSQVGPTFVYQYNIVAYDATRFFVQYILLGSTGNGQIGSAAFPLSDAQGFTINIRVPIANWSATEAQNINLTSSVLDQEVDSTVRLHTSNGYGSTATRIRRFSNIVTNIGDAILYQDSATNGASFTALKDGVYSFSYTDEFSATSNMGLSLNSASLTTNIGSISANERLVVSQPFSANSRASCSWQGYLSAGDIVRPHADAVSSGATPAYATFTASYEGKLKQVNINPNSKITIPTSELRFEGASTRGSTDTAIVRFDNVANLRGDAFTVVSDATVGTAITMRKAGRLTVSGSLKVGSLAQTIQITRNQVTRTSISSTASEILVSSGSSGASNLDLQGSWTGTVVVGDVIRVATNNAVSANAGNVLTLSFQEQDIAVAVTNIQPKFSEADSSVRVDTANGYGSTGTRIRRFSNIRDNLGTDIQYVDSATDGASFRIMKDGVYAVSFTDSGGTSSNIGISKNASSLSTDITALASSERLAFDNFAAGGVGTASWEGYLVSGDVIRAHTNGAAAANNAFATFTISKVGKPNITSVDVTPFVDIPQPQQQTIEALTTTTTFGATNTGVPVLNITRNTTTGIITVISNSTDGTSFRVNKRCKLNVSASISFTGAQTGFITRNSTTLTAALTGITGQLSSQSLVGGAGTGTAAAEIIAEANDVIRVQRDGTGVNAINNFVLTAEALSDQILTQPETFSSDTAPFVYAPSSAYTLSTLANAPVGTFITFTYAANTNTRTQTTTAPTQTVGDMNVNGVRVFTRAYNASSTAGNPACAAIQIGKGLKGYAIELFANTAKTELLKKDRIAVGVESQGLDRDYDEKTGILIIDAGFQPGTVTSAIFKRADALTDINVTSSYVVINASKNPALVGLGVDQVVAASYSLSTNQTSNTTTPIPFNVRQYDTHNACTSGTGFRFTAPIGGLYQVSGRYISQNTTVITVYKNGTAYGPIGVNSGSYFNSSTLDLMLVAGDYVDVRFVTSQTATGGAMGTADISVFNIKRVGNLG